MDKNSEIPLEEVTFPNDEKATFNLGNPKWKYHCFLTSVIHLKELPKELNLQDNIIDFSSLYIEEDNEFQMISKMEFPSGREVVGSMRIEKKDIGNLDGILKEFEILTIGRAYSKDKTAKSLWKEMINNPDMIFNL